MRVGLLDSLAAAFVGARFVVAFFAEDFVAVFFVDLRAEVVFFAEEDLRAVAMGEPYALLRLLPARADFSLRGGFFVPEVMETGFFSAAGFFEERLAGASS